MNSPALTHTQEKKLLHALFFLFGFLIMAWVPRFPEVKDGLHLSNGVFGSILTTGSIGAFLGLLTVGHIVHKVGVFKVTLAAILLLSASLAVVVQIHSAVYFIICNIIIGFGITSLHVALNTQGFHVQERSGDIVVTSSAGYWSAGALVTAGLSGLFVGNVGLALHIGLLSLFCTVTMVYLLVRLNPVLVRANTRPETDYSIKDIFTGFHLDWPVSLGMACAVYLEFAVGDWGTIFTKERLDINSGLSTLPYIVFTIFIIFGRLTVQKILHKYSIELVARTSTIMAGATFGICIAIATHLPASAKWYSFALFLIGFSAAGLGSAVMGPSFTSAANRRSPHPSSVVVGQFGVMNNVLTTALKWIVAGVIAATGSIALALMIPAALMVCSAFFTKTLRD
jgi:MFS family permease